MRTLDRSWKRVLTIIVLVGSVSTMGSAGTLSSAKARAARDILEHALSRRYRCDTQMVLELTVKNAFGEALHRRIHAASKWIDGRLHGIARIVDPPYLRGTGLLTIENEDRSEDQFLFLPSLGRVRRVMNAQRGDAFLGTDLSYEDFERRRSSDYQIDGMSIREIDGERVYRISARPRFGSRYSQLEIFVADSDFAILQIRYFNALESSALKIVRTPRASIRSFEDCWIPMRIVVWNNARHTQTDLRIEKVIVDPAPDDRLFSVRSLQAGRPIAHLGR